MCGIFSGVQELAPEAAASPDSLATRQLVTNEDREDIDGLVVLSPEWRQSSYSGRQCLQGPCRSTVRMDEPAGPLFDPIVPDGRRNPLFETLRTRAGYRCGRRMLAEVFRDFHDADGNFIEQFQSQGFNARLFELYLFAAFREQGFDIERPHPNPDFILSTAWDRFAVEATTTNPSESGPLVRQDGTDGPGNVAAQLDYELNEFPMRLGSALYSKLKKRYWESPTCRDLPFVIAIEPFHDQQALWASGHGVRRYLYGQEFADPVFRNGRLDATRRDVVEHRVGTKSIPSGFFKSPGAEHVSAVLITNQGASSKFTRMGYGAGFGDAAMVVSREGLAFDRHPESTDAMMFRYWMDSPPIVETWADGIILIHNPNALRPLRDDAFKDVWQVWERGDHLEEYIPDFAVYSSFSHTMSGTGPIAERGGPPRIAKWLPNATAKVLTGGHGLRGSPWREEKWFANGPETKLGVLIENDGVWSYMVLLPDEDGDFVPTHEGQRYGTRIEARTYLYHELLVDPKPTEADTLDATE